MASVIVVPAWALPVKVAVVASLVVKVTALVPPAVKFEKPDRVWVPPKTPLVALNEVATLKTTGSELPAVIVPLIPENVVFEL